MATRDDKRAALTAGLDRLQAVVARKRADIAALPAPAARTPAQRRAAQDTRDWMLLARTLLALTGRLADADLDDTGVAE